MQKLLLDVTFENIASSFGIKTLGSYSKEEQLELIQSYYKFIFVRNPFDRLLSAYRDKIQCGVREENCGQQQKHKKHGTAILKIFRQNVSASLLESGKSVTFQEFLRYVTENIKGRRDWHWTSYVKQYDLCALEFDFIGKVETLNADVNYVLSKLLPGKNNELYFPHSNNRGAKKHNYYESIDKKIIEKITKVFGNDFEAFNYQKQLPIN